MYLTLLTVAVFAYAVQNTLFGALVRRHDLAMVVTWRGLSLLVTMSPLLLLADRSRFAGLAEAAGPLALACGLAAAANLCASVVVRCLPIGIANAFNQGLAAVFTLALAWPILGEQPGGPALVWIALVLGAVGWLGAAGGRGPQPVTRATVVIGISAAIVFGLLMAGALLALKLVTATADPFLAAWAWEGGIGLVCLGGLLVRRILRRGAPVAAAPAVLGRIALCAWPTLLGTGCYTRATTLGGLGTAGAVLSTIMVGAAIFARWFLGERLTGQQWAAILAACGAVVGLSLAGA
jgi:drug/metabolite transporter (DMT)-like permease